MYISVVSHKGSRRRRLTFDASRRPRSSFLAVISHVVVVVPYCIYFDPENRNDYCLPRVFRLLSVACPPWMYLCLRTTREIYIHMVLSVFFDDVYKRIYEIDIFILLHFSITTLWYSFGTIFTVSEDNHCYHSVFFFFFVSSSTWHFTNDFTVCRIAFYIWPLWFHFVTNKTWKWRQNAVHKVTNCEIALSNSYAQS